jgi:excisionase family DNA binding protein
VNEDDPTVHSLEHGSRNGSDVQRPLTGPSTRQTSQHRPETPDDPDDLLLDSLLVDDYPVVLSPAHAAALLGVTRRTLLEELRRIPAIKMGHRTVRYRTADLTAYLMDRRWMLGIKADVQRIRRIKTCPTCGQPARLCAHHQELIHGYEDLFQRVSADFERRFPRR